MFVRVVGPGDKGEGEGGHPSASGGSSPLWMRVLALEIFRGLCSDFSLMIKFYERYDVPKKKSAGKEGSSVFGDLMMALNRLSTEKHGILGVGAAIIYGSSLSPITIPGAGVATSSVSSSSNAGMLDSAVEMGLGLAQVAGSVVGNTVAAGGSTSASLAVSTASMKLQCIDQLDKAESPPIPDTYLYLLALQCLCSLAEGFATHALAIHANIITSSAHRKASAPPESPPRAPSVIQLSKLDQSDPKVASLLTIKEMGETSWPALLASLSFFISTSLDDELFAEVVSALQSFTSVCGVVGLDTPREAFLTSLCKFAVPPSVVAHIAALDSTPTKSSTSVLGAGVVDSLGLGPAASLPVGLSSRNYACLKALLSVAELLAGSLNTIWFAVFETLQNVDFVIRANVIRSKKRLSSAGSPISPLRPSMLLGVLTSHSNPTATNELDETSIQASINKLFEVSKTLDDDSFKWFVGGLCRLNGEMVGIPMNENGAVQDVPMTAGLASPGLNENGIRRRASGISTIRTLVSHVLGLQSNMH
jgi:hypothetical protein